MRRCIRYLFTIVFVPPVVAFGQAMMKFDSTVYDLGQIPQSGTIYRELKFTNTGNEPLVITSVTTGDGGSFAEYPKEPIPPGKSSAIKFVYDANRIGPFDRGVCITSNAATAYSSIHVKGEIVFNRSTVKADSDEVDVGEIKFGEVDTAGFFLQNTGDYTLHITLNEFAYPETDLIWSRFLSLSDTGIVNGLRNKMEFDKGERFCLKILLRNNYGNTGSFRRDFRVIYNSHDTLDLFVKGTYTGSPMLDRIVEGDGHYSYFVYYYENEHLVKKESYREFGFLVSEDFYSGSNIAMERKYGNGYYYTEGEKVEECYYSEGKMISRKKLAN